MAGHRGRFLSEAHKPVSVHAPYGFVIMTEDLEELSKAPLFATPMAAADYAYRVRGSLHGLTVMPATREQFAAYLRWARHAASQEAREVVLQFLRDLRRRT